MIFVRLDLAGRALSSRHVVSAIQFAQSCQACRSPIPADAPSDIKPDSDCTIQSVRQGQQKRPLRQLSQPKNGRVDHLTASQLDPEKIGCLPWALRHLQKL